MNKLSIVGAACLAASSVMAQNVYSPPGIGSTEDGLYSYYYGRYSNMRHMMVDGEHPSTGVYKSMALRLDGRSHSTSTAMGRSWTNVTLDLSVGDFSNFSQTFSANITTTPTRVFSGSVSWATQSGTPANSPATWGGNGAVFPFGTGGTTSTYLHLSGDILVDTNFSGGTMANGVSWSGSSGRSYYHDGPASATSSSSGAGRYIPSSRLNRTATMPCNDSAMSTSTGSYTYANATAYGGAYSIINYRNQLLWYWYSYYCGYDNPVIHGVGVQSLEPGVDLGTDCNKLHVGNIVTSYALVTLPQAANSSGYTGYQQVFVPHNAAFVGIPITVQGAFADTQTSRFVLTQAYERTIPAVMPQVMPRRIATYHYTPTSATGATAPNTSYIYNPSLCWAQ